MSAKMSARASLVALLPLALAFGPLAHADLATTMSPGGNFDLTHWVLTVPADVDGGTSGPAISIFAGQLSGAAGYFSPWFYTGTDGAMTFWAPVDGATVGGSSHPRSELREVLDPADTSVNWSDAGNSQLWGQAKILRAPSNGRVVVAQVHGYNTNPLVLLQFEYSTTTSTGNLVAIMETYPGADPHDGSAHLRFILASGLRLGQAITYQISVSNNGTNGVVSAVANSGPTATMTMDPRWDAVTFYFKAGSYPQDDEGPSSEGGEVRYFRLVASHPNLGLVVTTPSSLPHATAGQTYFQSLRANGGSRPLVWSLASGVLPPGLAIDPAGAVRGKPLPNAGSPTAHTFSTLATDSVGNTVAKTFSLVIDVDPTRSIDAIADPEHD